ncbi:pyridoxamine 5'-phosphate oxidase family protein [Amycolatopsis sp. NPDC059090]|uniref:pyridoxamine 5'-phosphate oxidase family protein n=1 Tax=Amycolatopsis sp. NPDC059090 TaxID=3346723 RepID=UPI003672D913
MKLTIEECETFLAQPHVASLSVASGPGRGLLTVPIWYRYLPDGEIVVITGRYARKAEMISVAGCFSMLVNVMTRRQIRYVSVDGPVVRTGPATDEMVRSMAARYLAPDKVEEYVAAANAERGEQLAISMRPEHWLARDVIPG